MGSMQVRDPVEKSGGDTQVWKRQRQKQNRSKTGAIAYKHSLHYGSAGNVHTPDIV